MDDWNKILNPDDKPIDECFERWGVSFKAAHMEEKNDKVIPMYRPNNYGSKIVTEDDVLSAKRERARNWLNDQTTHLP
jgi:hypothetical protein